jgi:hypothetical protein
MSHGVSSFLLCLPLPPPLFFYFPAKEGAIPWREQTPRNLFLSFDSKKVRRILNGIEKLFHYVCNLYICMRGGPKDPAFPPRPSVIYYAFLSLCRHTRIIGRQYQRRGTMGKNQHWQNEIVVHWEGLFQKITHYCSTGELQQKWIFILKILFPQKLYNVRFTNSTHIHGRAAIAKSELIKGWFNDH